MTASAVAFSKRAVDALLRERVAIDHVAQQFFDLRASLENETRSVVEALEIFALAAHRKFALALELLHAVEVGTGVGSARPRDHRARSSKRKPKVNRASLEALGGLFGADRLSEKESGRRDRAPRLGVSLACHRKFLLRCPGSRVLAHRGSRFLLPDGPAALGVNQDYHASWEASTRTDSRGAADFGFPVEGRSRVDSDDESSGEAQRRAFP